MLPPHAGISLLIEPVAQSMQGVSDVLLVCVGRPSKCSVSTPLPELLVDRLAGWLTAIWCVPSAKFDSLASTVLAQPAVLVRTASPM
jgi:hypothetical protein